MIDSNGEENSPTNVKYPRRPYKSRTNAICPWVCGIRRCLPLKIEKLVVKLLYPIKELLGSPRRPVRWCCYRNYIAIAAFTQTPNCAPLAIIDGSRTVTTPLHVLFEERVGRMGCSLVVPLNNLYVFEGVFRGGSSAQPC